MKQAKTTDSRRQKAVEEKSRLFANAEMEDRLTMTPLEFHSKRILDFDGITVQYGEKPLFEHLSFSVDAGERIALCGPNGCGKSSLLKILAGEGIPYSGQVIVPKSLKISCLPQDASHLSGQMSDWVEQRKIDESRFKTFLHKLGFLPEQFGGDMEFFSAGQKKKALLAASLCESAHLYLWDEPLNFIDVISRIQIENLLLQCCPTLIFVEHDETFLGTVTTKRIEIPDFQN